MGRITFNKATKGSQKWLQKLINNSPDILNKSITSRLGDTNIEWLSPLKEDEYAEYSDRQFIEKLGLDLSILKLSEFWPSRGGPQWDALGKSKQGHVFLVEAKSHTDEIKSTKTRAKDKSLERITKSLEKVKDSMGITDTVDWSENYYQYTNRLAHLYLLRENNIPAFLVLVYFINDVEMNGPKTISEWKTAIDQMKKNLKIMDNKLDNYIIESFIDVKKLL
jgi:hypothetical protein